MRNGNVSSSCGVPGPGGNFRTNRAHTNSIAGQIESNYDEVTDSFDNMNLKAELLRGMLKMTKIRNRWKLTNFQVCMHMVSNDHLLFSSGQSCQSSKVHILRKFKNWSRD